jgi:hypothetical protein
VCNRHSSSGAHAAVGSCTVITYCVWQEWQARRSQGAVALTALQGLLGQLEQAAMLPGSTKFWQRMTSQVQ